MTSNILARGTKILGSVNPFTMRGVEIGPLNNPLVSKQHGDILYVDYATTEELRQHPFDSSVNPADIVNVDVVWAERPLIECVPPTHKTCDYVLAAHVIEHVPDLIGWLLDIRAILKDGGTLGLAIPDRRFTFDFCRNESTVGEMVEAYLLKYRRPSLRQVFDCCWLAVKLDMNDAWAANPADRELPKFQGDVALQFAFDQAAEIAVKPRYIDSHCWVFTPAGFLENVSALTRLGLFPFLVEFVEPTLVGTLEFIVRLTATDGAKKEEILRSITRAKETVKNSPDERQYATNMANSRGN